MNEPVVKDEEVEVIALEELETAGGGFGGFADAPV